MKTITSDEESLCRFAQLYGLPVRGDECGDLLIPGRQGHLYFDGGQLCLMMLDAGPVKRRRLENLVSPDGSVWQGDISRGVQDATVKGISSDRHREAIGIAGVKRKRSFSSEARAALIARIKPQAA